MRATVRILIAALALFASAFWLALSGVIWLDCPWLGALMGALGGLAFGAALWLLGVLDEGANGAH